MVTSSSSECDTTTCILELPLHKTWLARKSSASQENGALHDTLVHFTTQGGGARGKVQAAGTAEREPAGLLVAMMSRACVCGMESAGLKDMSGVPAVGRERRLGMFERKGHPRV